MSMKHRRVKPQLKTESYRIDFRAPSGFHGHSNRRLKVYVDLENACGGSIQVRQNQKQIQHTILQIRECFTTQVTYSVGPNAINTCPELIWDWSFARFLPARGIDGADLALLAAIKSEPFRQGMDKLILVSGDHIFADEVSALTAIGIHTTVISQKHALSTQLLKAAIDIQYLPEFSQPETERRTA